MQPHSSRNHRHSEPPPSPSLARRAWPAVALIGASGALVMALDRPASTELLVGADEPDADQSADAGLDGDTLDSGADVEPPATSAAPVTAAETADDPLGQNGTSRTPASTSESQDEEAATTEAPETTRAPATTEAADTTAESSSSDCETHKGPTVSTKWGPVQVKASVAPDGTICSVTVLQVPEGRKSDSINARAVPILNERVLDAQSADIDNVSGATITWRAYRQSLQAILDAVVS